VQFNCVKKTARKTELNVLWHSTGFPSGLSVFLSLLRVFLCAWLWWERHFKTERKFRFYVISNCKLNLILQSFTQLSLLSTHISPQRRLSFIQTQLHSVRNETSRTTIPYTYIHTYIIPSLTLRRNHNTFTRFLRSYQDISHFLTFSSSKAKRPPDPPTRE